MNIKGTAMGNERRRADRMLLKIPVILNGGEGVTRDANSGGVYFETDVDFAVGSEIDFALKFANHGCPVMVWECKGRVVRVERKGRRLGVATRILRFELQSASKTSQSLAHAHF
jgi:hypothetical protein